MTNLDPVLLLPPAPPQVFEIFTNYNRTLRPDGRAEVTNRIIFKSSRCGPCVDVCGCVHSLWSIDKLTRELQPYKVKGRYYSNSPPTRHPSSVRVIVGTPSHSV